MKTENVVLMKMAKESLTRSVDESFKGIKIIDDALVAKAGAGK